MESYTKFEGIDYVNNFAKRINSVHELVKSNLPKFIKSNASIIDIGGGPAIGAKIIDNFGVKVTLLNIEPSTNISNMPELVNVQYMTKKTSFSQALSQQLPFKADLVLLISSAHEIALAYKKGNEENKTAFFMDLKMFLRKNTQANSFLCIGFPNYKEGVSSAEVEQQRSFVDKLLGHSHPPEENFYIADFTTNFNCKPIIYKKKTMVLANEDENDSKLMANFAVFSIADILV